MITRFKKIKERYLAFKKTKEFRKDAFFKKQKIKLIFLIFPAVLLCAYAICNVTTFDKFIVYLIAAVLAVVGVNYGAQILTDKNFKD